MSEDVDAVVERHDDMVLCTLDPLHRVSMSDRDRIVHAQSRIFTWVGI